MSLASMPPDIVDLIVQKSTPTLEELMENLPTRELYKLHYVIDEKIRGRSLEIGKDLKKGCVYRMKWSCNSKKFENYVVCRLNTKKKFHFAFVLPDADNNRIFGNYKLDPEQNGFFIYPVQVEELELLYEPPVVDWKNVKKCTLIGVSEPYKIFPDILDEYMFPYPVSGILYDKVQVAMVNKFAVVELYKVHRDHITIAFPQDTLDPAPNRSIIVCKIPKRICYELTKEFSHVRSTVVY